MDDAIMEARNQIAGYEMALIILLASVSNREEMFLSLVDLEYAATSQDASPETIKVLQSIKDRLAPWA